MDEKIIRVIITAIEACIVKIAAALAKGDRIELIPVKNGVKIIRVKREEVKL